MVRSGNPRIRQKVMKSSSITSSIVLRISSVGSPCRYRASVNAGSVRWRRKSHEATWAHQVEYALPGLVAPDEGNQFSVKLNTASASMPTQNSGAARVASTAGMPHASAHDPRGVRQQERGQREDEGVRQYLPHHLTHRLAAEEGAAELSTHQI